MILNVRIYIVFAINVLWIFVLFVSSVGRSKSDNITVCWNFSCMMQVQNFSVLSGATFKYNHNFLKNYYIRNIWLPIYYFTKNKCLKGLLFRTIKRILTE